jgi:tryptophan-rich sensory protein
MNSKTKQIVFLFSFITLSLLTGYLSSQLSGVSMVDTYSHLSRPVFAPPAWLFAPVWFVLYVLMGTSAYLIWRLREKENVKKPLVFFFVQLVLNLLWPIIFFGLGQYVWAFVDIVVLLIMIVFMIESYSKVSKASAYLLFPYLLWVGFASILNFAIAFA